MADDAAGVSPPQEAWQVAAAQALPALQEAQSALAAAAAGSQRSGLLRVLKSSQLDAAKLDEELTSMLQEQFMRVFSLFHPGRISDLEPELNAILLLLVYWLSVWQGRATPGSQLLNLRYRNERAASGGLAGAGGAGGGHSGVDGPMLSRGQRAMLGAGHVLVPYLWARAARALSASEPGGFSGGGWGGSGGGGGGWRGGGGWGDDNAGGYDEGTSAAGGSGPQWAAWRRRLREGAWRALRWGEAAYRAAALANFWAFLAGGAYRDLLERAVGARLVYRQPNMTRIISFEYLNRQLVWQEVSELLLLLLPMAAAAPQAARALAARLLPRLPDPAEVLAQQRRGAVPAGAPGSSAAQQEQHKGDGPGAAWGSACSSGSGMVEGPPGAQAAHAGGATATSTTAQSAPPEARPQGPCPVCSSREILVPFLALPCRHVFCYYCLRGSCEAGGQQGYVCPQDGVRVRAMARWAPALS